MSEQRFTISAATALLPEIRLRASEIIRLRADLTELTFELRESGSSQLGGRAEAKACEARLGEHLLWFTEQGIQIKSLAPFLIDFPAELDGRQVLLCWLEGEREIGWYHRAELGFAARRPLPRVS